MTWTNLWKQKRVLYLKTERKECHVYQDASILSNLCHKQKKWSSNLISYSSYIETTAFKMLWVQSSQCDNQVCLRARAMKSTNIRIPNMWQWRFNAVFTEMMKKPKIMNKHIQ